MSKTQKKVFSPDKLAVNQERVEAYCRNEPIYPVTMELDLTQKCTRSCPNCPYGAARRPGLTLSLEFLAKLFAVLGPHVPGLVLSGGEPTSVPYYPEVLALARQSGFQEICTITNGSLLHEPRVQDALLQHATAVRVSLYDWQEGESPYFRQSLQSLATLKQRAVAEGSGLSIAASLLTHGDWVDRLGPVGRQALATGMDWLYFHPFCVDWDTQSPCQAPQEGVLEAVERLQQENRFAGEIQFPYARYDQAPLEFSKLHAGHFLLQVGADGVNYAGPECKYEPDYALLDLNEYLEEDFLWLPERTAKLAAMNSDNYRPIGTRHRPPIISAYVQSVMENGAPEVRDQAGAYHQPNVI